MNNKIKNTKGFTIIEVVLVLAIAALIFLMVFIALPTLRANQRDAARKTDASKVVAAVTDYTTTERKSVTSSTSASDVQKYIDKLDQYDVANVVIEKAPSVGAEFDVPDDQVVIYPGVKCDGTKVKAGTSRTFAVFVRLESGSDGVNYCVGD